MQTGIQGRYQWLEADQNLREFLSICPTAILGKYIAITAVDSGSFFPSEEDRSLGWTTDGGIAYSPRIDSVSKLPSKCCCRDCGPFDEWYIFKTQPTPLGLICHANVFQTSIAAPDVFQFFNFGGFQLSDPKMKDITDPFWEQIRWVRPESYLADGNRCLVFVSSDQELFGSIREVLKSHS